MAFQPPVATIPIDLSDGIKLDAREARKFGERFSERYCSAEPFPHIGIDNFLPKALIDQILENFPTNERESDMVFEKGYSGLHKRAIYPNDCNRFVRDLFAFLNSAPILQFLEGLTQIDGLIADPYFNGGGFHDISTGGLLGVHADFRLHETLRLQRRINMLIYLNPGWDPEWGGQLGLWDRSIKNELVKIDPVLNRCAIFNTDAYSFHGHPDPLMSPPGTNRRSIAIYYYTASPRITEDIPANSTIYVPRNEEAFSHRYEAWRVRMFSHLKDWLPPIMFRTLRKLQGKPS
jgi:hypothetical protein